MIGLALPLINKRIGPNLFYGFRVPSTVKDKEKWYPVNAMMGKWLLASALIFLVTALGLYFVPGISVDQYAMGSLASFVIPFATLGVLFPLFTGRGEDLWEMIEAQGK